MSGRDRCLVCGKGFLEPAEVEEKMYGISLGTYQGEVCEKCGETFLKGDEMDRAEARARELGLWGLERKVKIGKSGNSLIVRIPARIADFLDLEPGREVFLVPEGKGRLILEPESR
jgi:hypothetical protein